MRILFVTPWIPSRIRPRSYGFLKHLAHSNEVWLLAAHTSGESLDDVHALALAGIHTVRRKPLRSVLRALGTLPTRTSLQVALLDDPRFHERMRAVIDEVSPDLVHMNVIRSAALLRSVPPHVARVFDLDDIRSDYYSQLSTASRSRAWRAIGKVEAPRLRSLELEIAADSDTTIVSSPLDVPRLNARTVLVRSPHDQGSPPTTLRTPRRDTVLFVGRLGYRANREALDAFIEGPWPRIRQQNPAAELVVVGEDPRGKYQSDSTRGIRVTGYVPSVTPFYESASVAIVPVSMATGVQMKLIQALAQGVPTVTTSLAARQAGLPDGVAKRVDTEDGWVSSVLELLASPADAEALGGRGQGWARQHYSNQEIGRSLDGAHMQGLIEAEHRASKERDS